MGHVEDLVAALKQAGVRAEEGGPAGATLRELKTALSIGDRTLRGRLRAAIAEGRVRPVRLQRRTLVGVVQPVWGYALVEETRNEGESHE